MKLLVKQKYWPFFVRLSSVAEHKGEMPQVLLAIKWALRAINTHLARLLLWGGSIAPRGGHNALEPAALRCALY